MRIGRHDVATAVVASVAGTLVVARAGHGGEPAATIRLAVGFWALYQVMRRAFRERRPNRVERSSGWSWTAVAVLFAVGREVARTFIGFDQPDNAFLLLSGLLSVASAVTVLWRLAAGDMGHVRPAREVLEATVIAGSLAIIGWVVMFGDRYAASMVPTIRKASALVGPVTCLFVAAFAVLVFARAATGRRSAIGAFIGGVAALLIAEAMVAYALVAPSAATTGALVGWSSVPTCVAWVLFGLGSNCASTRMEDTFAGGRSGARLSWALYGVASALGFAFAIPRLRPAISDPVLLEVCTFVIGAHVFHQILMVFENRRLVDTLDARVDVRTAELASREHYYRALFEHSTDVIAVIDGDHRYRDLTPSLLHVLGWAPDDLAGTRFDDLLAQLGAGEALAAYRRVLAVPGAQESASARLPHADGSWRESEIRVRNLRHDPAIGGVVVTVRDVTVRRELERELIHHAFHDALTGLPNRPYFRSAVESALERTRSTGETVHVLFLDLDGFKGVNDSFGHPTGDALLQAFSARFSPLFRGASHDAFARLGGDEFAILLEPGVDPDAFAASIVSRLRSPFVVEGTTIQVGASIGFAASADAASVDDLMRNADVAMYRAKHSGETSVVRFEASMREEAALRLHLTSELRIAVEDDALEVWLQPIMELTTMRLTGFEALVRWHDPVLGSVPPSTFIPLAEESGLIVALGEFVLRRACRAIARIREEGGSDLTVAVNLSARQLESPGLNALVRQVLVETGLEGSALTLEVTESMVMSDPASASDRLRRLAALGVRIALDDFGTGYSSLAVLQRFPLDVLKVDRTFVSAIGRNPESAGALLAAIEQVARSLGLGLIAEGVESETELEFLVGLGYGRGQGYLLGRPMPVEDAVAFARSSVVGAARTWQQEKVTPLVN